MLKFLHSILIDLLQTINEAVNNNIDGFLATTKISLIVTPFVYTIDKVVKWSVQNETYVMIVMGAIFIDWIFGSIKHIFFTKTFTLKNNAIGLIIKITLAVGGGFLFEGLNFLVSDSDTILSIMKTITRVIVFMYPALSAFENIYIVSGEKFPPKAWMERLKKWNNSLDPNDLTNKNE